MKVWHTSQVVNKLSKERHRKALNSADKIVPPAENGSNAGEYKQWAFVHKDKRAGFNSQSKDNWLMRVSGEVY
jgi:hypothetical protein